jgi:Zinc-binding dehydrogenase
MVTRSHCRVSRCPVRARAARCRTLDAEQIILMGRQTDRTDLGRDFGATDVVAERGDQAVEKVRDLTGGDGTHAVIECVGTEQSLATAVSSVREGGVVSRLGESKYTAAFRFFPEGGIRADRNAASSSSSKPVWWPDEAVQRPFVLHRGDARNDEFALTFRECGRNQDVAVEGRSRVPTSACFPRQP